MLSLYIHIPFCHHKCIYCDFYSIAQKYDFDLYTQTLIKEIENTDNIVSNVSKDVSTIYFGGGTPSILSLDNLKQIITCIEKNFDVQSDAEKTLEANPENISLDYAFGLKSLGFNRISLGVQSFDDKDLKLLNRSHNSLMAKQAILTLQQVGFKNISVDLISNLPNTTLSSWKKNLERVFFYNIPHISCYTLMREEGTMLDILLKKEKLQFISEEEQLEQMDFTMDFLAEKGYNHYETSSYAIPGFESKHNTRYWQNGEYIGFGAAAHSFVDNTRFWNESNVKEYVKRINEGNFSKKGREEKLSLKDRYNEYVMLRSRLSNGLNSEYVKDNLPEYYSYFLTKLSKIKRDGYLTLGNTLTRKGWHLQDSMILELAL